MPRRRQVEYMHAHGQTELWDAYDRDGNLIGTDLVRGEDIPEGQYHIVCDVLVRHVEGDYLLMLRDGRKPIHPGRWEATAGGSALKGEDAKACVKRELLEETGIDGTAFEQTGREVVEDGHCIYYSFFCETDCDKASVRLQEGETADYRWLSEREFIEFVNSDEIMPSQRRRHGDFLRRHGYLKEDELGYAIHQYCRNMDEKRELDDLLLQTGEKDEWTGMLADRARRLQELYQENEKILAVIRERISRPLTQETAERLFSHAEFMYFNNYDDLILLEMAEALKEYYEQHYDLSKLLHLYSCLNFENLEIRERRSGGELFSHKYVDRILQLREHYREVEESDRRRIYFVAYYNMIVAGFANGQITADESYRLLKEMDAFWHSKEVQELDGKNESIKERYERTKKEWFVCEEEIERASEETQRAFCRIVKKYYEEQSGEEGDIACENDIYMAYLHALVLEGEISWAEAVERGFAYYQERVKKYSGEGELEEEEFYFLLNVPTMLERWLHQDVPDELRNRMIEALKLDTEKIIYPRLREGMSPIVNRTLTEWCFRMMTYLKGSEKEEWLFHLLVQRQLPTYLHSEMVKNLALELLGAAREKRPELFEALPEEISGEGLTEFVRMCALLHDVGKTKITDIINTQDRGLADEEFDAIRMHTDFGAGLLEAVPELEKYKDVIRGHHKFYDGSGGYPEGFDNTASPYRIVIDLITICDCLDAATDGMGRNYKKVKNFDQVLKELVQGKGVRYNPDLVDIIQESPKLQEKMAAMTGRERADKVYEIYSRAN